MRWKLVLVALICFAQPGNAKKSTHFKYPEMNSARVCFVSPFYDTLGKDDKYFSGIFGIEIQKAVADNKLSMSKIDGKLDALLFSQYSDANRNQYFMNLPDTVYKSGIDFLLFIYRISYIKDTDPIRSGGGGGGPMFVGGVGGGVLVGGYYAPTEELAPINNFKDMSFKLCLINLKTRQPVFIDSIATKQHDILLEPSDAMDRAVRKLISRLTDK
jgi:hypothetical protein